MRKRVVALGFGLVLIALALLMLHAKRLLTEPTPGIKLSWRGYHASVAKAKGGTLKVSRKGRHGRDYGVRSSWMKAGDDLVELRGRVRSRSPRRAGALKVIVKVRSNEGPVSKEHLRAGHKWRAFRLRQPDDGAEKIQAEVVVKTRKAKARRFALSQLRLVAHPHPKSPSEDGEEEPPGGNGPGDEPNGPGGGGEEPGDGDGGDGEEPGDGDGSGGDGDDDWAPTVSQMATVTDHEEHLLEVSGSPYRYMIFRDQLRTELPAMRAANPKTEMFVYKNLAFVLEEPGCPWWPYQGSGVDWCQANDNPDWFLHDKNTGQRINSDAYPFQWAMNVADPDYRRQWIDNVLDRLETEEYDGVFIDDTNLYPGHGMDGRIAELTDAEYRQAIVDFIDQIARELHEHGYQVMPNVALSPWEAPERAAALEIADDVAVFNREYYIRWGEGSEVFTGDGYLGHFELAEDVMADGNAYNGMIYGYADETEVMRYGRATFLLAWDGETPSSMTYRTPEGNSWFEAWTTDIGVPTGPRYAVGSRGLRRDYSGGTVVLNYRSGSQTFALGGSYERPDGSCTDQVTLASARALVMPRC